MVKKALSGLTRILLTISGVLLIVVLFVPMWRIDLDAPQYPEGLRLLIYPNKIAGDVEIINGLNHYIGMKTIHTSDFIEFTLLPYIICFFAVFFILTAILKSTRLMYILLVMFVSFGVLAMADFWKWEYDYGHNLNPEAAIIVPGMAYQPPLIGFKQLLNFGAYSIPDIGGWLFISAGLILIICVIIHIRKIKLTKQPLYLALFICLFCISCNPSADPIKVGVDICQYCKMNISDVKYGAEVITKKGKIYKYDEAHCLISAIKEHEIELKEINKIYLTDFAGDHQLIEKDQSYFLKSELLRSPMAGNVAVFSNKDSLLVSKQKFKGSEVFWEQICK